MPLTSDPDRKLLELAAGCLYEHDRYPNSHHLIDITFNDAGRPLQYDLWFRGWSKRGFWHNQNDLYRNTKDGRLTWRITYSQTDTAPGAVPSIESKEETGNPIQPNMPNDCEHFLAKLSHSDLSRLLQKKLSRSEVEDIWFQVFESRLNDDYLNNDKNLCINELYLRAKQHDKLSILFQSLCRKRPDLADRP